MVGQRNALFNLSIKVISQWISLHRLKKRFELVVGGVLTRSHENNFRNPDSLNIHHKKLVKPKNLIERGSGKKIDVKTFMHFRFLNETTT